MKTASPRGPVLAGLALLCTALPLACSGDGAAPEDTTISRDAFVEVYVALRAVGLRTPSQVLPEEDRIRILEEQGVTQEELFSFVEVHGRNVEFMQEVWNEVESRIEDLRTQPDSGTGRSS